MAERTCSVDGCEKPSYQRGWCSTHYSRWYKTGRLDKRPKATPRPCSVDGCEGLTRVPGTARGFCSAHYNRWLRWGDPLGRPTYINKGNTCSVPGCEKAANERGLCGTHYSRVHRNGTVELVGPWLCAPEGQRWCGRCKAYKPHSEFYANRSKPDGLSGSCKECDRAKAADWRERNPEKVKAQTACRDRTADRERARRYRQNNPALVRIWGRSRRARLAGAKSEPFTRMEIAERDAWQCQICRSPIGRFHKWPDPRSLSIDHIVPLVVSGDHVRANVQATHLRCNLSKKAGGTDQLLLFG